MLKQASIDSDKLWKAGGKPRSGPLFLKRQSCRANYRKRLKDERTAETLSYTNELHEALLSKNCKTFWKCWNSKLEKYTKCTQVEGCVDAKVIVCPMRCDSSDWTYSIFVLAIF